MSKLGKLLGLGTLAAITAGTLAYVKKQQEAAAAETEPEGVDVPDTEDEDLKALFDEVDEAADTEEATVEAKVNADIIKKNLKEIFAIIAGGAKTAGTVVAEKVSAFAEENHLNEKFEELKNKIMPAKEDEEMSDEELKEAAEDLKAELDEELGDAAEEAKECCEEVKEAAEEIKETF